MYLMVVTRNGVSAKELERQLGVTYKCAWRIGHKIRELMDLLGMRSQLSGHVEVDESYIGGKRKGGKRGRGAEGKTIVFGTRERGGDVKGRVVSDVKRKTLEPIVRATVKEGSTGLAQKLQATTRGDGLFRIELPPLAPDPEFLCKAPAGMFHRLIGNFAAPSPLGDARSPL